MKKVINKKSKKESLPADIITDKTTIPTEKVEIAKLGILFGNEDMNKVVEKINEIIEKKCQ